MNAGSDGTLSGWGRVPVAGREVRSEDLEALTRDAVLCRGLGRSYGDSSLPPPGHPVVAATPLADRILAFDAVTGTLRAEAGLSLRALNRSFLPRGFYAPVTPGTQMITLGGMVAADVHGKNHHRDGSFCDHVLSMELRTPAGEHVRLTPDETPDEFWATAGGIGLTGVVTEATLQLLPIETNRIRVDTERASDLDALMTLMTEGEHFCGVPVWRSFPHVERRI